jgi:hypothetical protein
VEKAKKMVSKIIERYNATPYGFYFVTRSLAGQETKSGMYYLGGIVQTLKELKTENDPENQILIRNMENNRWNKVITNTNSWKVTRPFLKGDVVLEFVKPEIKSLRPKTGA